MYSCLAAKLVGVIATLACCAQSQDCVECLTMPCPTPPRDGNDPIWTTCFSCFQKGYPSRCSVPTAYQCALALLNARDELCNCSNIAATLVQGLQLEVPPRCDDPPPTSTYRPAIAAVPLQSGQFIIPQMTFSCHGCFQTLNITLTDGVGSGADYSTFYFQLWRRYTPISGQTSVVTNGLYQLNTSVPLTISASHVSHSNMYSLPLNVCFHEGDTIGIELPSKTLLRIATDNSSVIYKREIPAQCSDVLSRIFQPSLNYTGSPLIALITAPSSTSSSSLTLSTTATLSSMLVTTQSPTAVGVATTSTSTPQYPIPGALSASTILTLSAPISAGFVVVTCLGTGIVFCYVYKFKRKNGAKMMRVVQKPVAQNPGQNASTQETDAFKDGQGSTHSNDSYLSMKPEDLTSPLEHGSWNQEAYLSQSLPSTTDLAEEQYANNKNADESLEKIDQPTGQITMEAETTFGSGIQDNMSCRKPENSNGLAGMHDQKGTNPQVHRDYFVLESTKKDPTTGHNYHILEGQITASKKSRDELISGVSPPESAAFVNESRTMCEDDQFWEPSSIESIFFDQMKTKKFKEISNRDILIIQKLGSGEFGTVYKAQWNFQGGKQDVAVKTMAENGRPGAKVAFLQEAAIMGQFFHPNVVKMYGVVTNGKTSMIVYELMTNKDLSLYLTNHFMVPGSQPPSPNLLISCCKDVACGMKYLSQKGFVHRDLAARNILVNESMVCKIGDFGMSRRLEENYYVTKKGKIALNWAPPEVFEFGKFSTSSDVYSYGMLLYEIWSCGHRPMANYSPTEVRRLLSRGYCQPPPPLCPRKIYQLMVLCWNPVSKSRPTFQDIQSFLDISDQTLLSWLPEDMKIVESCVPCHGARPAEVSKLYRDLQQTYCPIDGTENPTAVGVVV